MPEAEEEEAEAQVLRKLKPKIPDHNDAHPVAENMKIRKDSGLGLWRQSDPYAVRRRTVVEQLQEDVEENKGKSTTDAFARVPRGQRSVAVPVPDMRATSSAPAATSS